MKEIKVSKWVIPQLLIFFIIGGKENLILGFLFIILHEMAHYYAARAMKVEVKKFNIHPLGATLEIEDYEGLESYEELIICLAGPAFNIFMAIITYLIFSITSINLIERIFEVNLSLGILNLIPAYPLDGCKILKTILSKIYLCKHATIISTYISLFFGALIISLGLILVFIKVINISLILIGIFIIYLTLDYKKRSMYIVLDQIIKKQIRFKKRKYIINQCVSIYYKENFLATLSYIEKNKFNIFYVLDDNMELLYKLKENEIFEIIKLYGNMTLEEYYLSIYISKGNL